MNPNIETILFSESQRFRHPIMVLVYILLSAVVIVFGYGIYQQMYLSIPFGDKPAPDIVLIVGFFLLSLLFCCFFFARLQLKINNEALQLRWFPFQRKWITYKWNEMDSISLVDYKFVGLGYRMGTEAIYFISGGNIGLLLSFKSGKNIVISIQKVEKLKEVFDSKQWTHKLEDKTVKKKEIGNN